MILAKVKNTSLSGPLKTIGVVLLAVAPFTSSLAASVNATLEWNRRVELTTTVSGKVSQVVVRPGAKVNRGEMLVKLDQTQVNAALKHANAELAKARHKYKEAKKEVERYKELFERTVISTHELELAKIAHTAALSRLRQAQAKVSLAKLNKRNSILRAPFQATVISLRVEKGSVISTRLQTPPMVILAERGKMKAVARVSLATVKSLRRGQTVSVTVNGKQYGGKVTLAGFEPVNKSGTPVYQLEVVFSMSADEVLRAGESATIGY